MGKRGPKKTPTNILRMRGSRLVETRPKNEPVPVKGIPDPPEYIRTFPVAMEEWYRKIKLLSDQGTIALIDDTMLGLYCLQYALLCDATKKVQIKDKEGFDLLTETKNKNIIQSPILSIINQATLKIERLAAEFGMSPSARSSINVTESPSKQKTQSQKWLEKQSGA